MPAVARAAQRLVLALLTLAAVPPGAEASLHDWPQVRLVCLRAQTVLRPAETSLAKAELDEPTPMVPVRICTTSRRACYAAEDEVSMRLCQAER